MFYLFSFNFLSKILAGTCLYKFRKSISDLLTLVAIVVVVAVVVVTMAC